jgi:Ser/Thr protein kinase RdoA (MazF antagonist)
MERQLDQPIQTAHGMGHELVEPDWPQLTLAEIHRIARHYPDIGRPDSVLWHSPRPFSAAAIALTETGPIFVKRHHRRVRSVEGLAEEHRFIAHLHKAGVRVVDMLANHAGSTVTAEGDWVYELHRAGEGDDLYRDALSWSPFQSPAHGYAAGRALGGLHRASQGFDAAKRSERLLVTSFDTLAATDMVEAIGRFVGERPALAAYLSEHDWRAALEEAVLPFHRLLLPYLDVFAPLWTHNDWHASNLLWQESDGSASVSLIFDFGLSDRTTRLFDLATAIERNCVQWLNLDADPADLVDWAGLDALLDGYDAVFPLSQIEGQALAALLPIVHVPFALSETDYFLAILESKDKADLGWNTYLLGHARWFTSAKGEGLLDHLRRRCANLSGH